MGHGITTITDKIARILAYLSGIAMLLLIVVLVGNAIMSQLGSPYGATYEVVSVLGVVVGGLALAEAQVYKSHIAIDILMKHAPKYFQLVFGLIMTVALIVLFGYLAWGLWGYLDLQRSLNSATDQLNIPTWMLIAPLFAGVVGLVIALIGDLGQISRSLRDKQSEDVDIW